MIFVFTLIFFFETNNLHLVRQKCVDFIQYHKEDFEPFICCSDIPFDHYLFEMRKSKCWGSQVEIQALSLMFKYLKFLS